MILLYIAIGIFFVSAGLAFLNRRIRRSEIDEWQVGDTILISPSSKHSGKKNVKLLWWSMDEVVVSGLEDGCKTIIKHSDIYSNKSKYWRGVERRCKDQMGVDRLDLGSPIKTGLGVKDMWNGFFDGKSLDLLNEIETQVYLKKAIEEENYSIAAKLREHSKKFR